VLPIGDFGGTLHWFFTKEEDKQKTIECSPITRGNHFSPCNPKKGEPGKTNTAFLEVSFSREKVETDETWAWFVSFGERDIIIGGGEKKGHPKSKGNQNRKLVEKREDQVFKGRQKVC